MLAENFRRDGTIREKYNVVTRSSETHVGAGYKANVVGFGWTNAAFLEFLHDLPHEEVERLSKDQDQAAAAAPKYGWKIATKVSHRRSTATAQQASTRVPPPH